MTIKEYLTKVLIPVILTIGVVIGMRACDRRKINEITNKDLSKGEQAAVIVDPNTGTVTVIKRLRKRGVGLRNSLLPGRKSKSDNDATVITKPVDGAREIRIAISPEGRIVVTARTKGFIFDPGFCFGEAEVLRVGMDVQWGFFHRWGAVSGVTTNIYKHNPEISFHTGVSYLLPWRFTQNTSVFVGVDTRKHVLVGFRTKL